MSFASIAEVVMWALILSLAVFAISISKKPKRILPASDSGLPVGAPFPAFQAQSVVNEVPFSVVYPQRKETLVLFSSSGCPICNMAYPLLPYSEQKYNLATKIVMEGQPNMVNQSIIDKIGNAGIKAPVYALTEEIKSGVKLEGFPFAYFLSADGRVLAKGIINTPPDIDLLVSQGRRAALRKLAG